MGDRWITSVRLLGGAGVMLAPHFIFALTTLIRLLLLQGHFEMVKFFRSHKWEEREESSGPGATVVKLHSTRAMNHWPSRQRNNATRWSRYFLFTIFETTVQNTSAQLRNFIQAFH